MRGPYLSTNQPSIGTSHVSVTTNSVKATWIAARSQPWRSCIGLTKKVQPYCMLAIMHMQTTPKASCSHRPLPTDVRISDIRFPPGRFYCCR